MDIAVVLLTAALVVTTGIYSFFTWRMADEMQKTRVQVLRPRLGLYVKPYGPTGGHLALRSLGPGTALEVDVKLRFTPSDQMRPWRSPVFSPGDEAEFFFPGLEELRLPGFKELEERGVEATVTGSMLDVTGRSHEVHEHLDVATWWNVVENAGQVYVTTSVEKAAGEIEKIRQTLQKIRTELERSRRGQ